MRPKPLLHLALAVTVCALLGACGGGGSDAPSFAVNAATPASATAPTSTAGTAPSIAIVALPSPASHPVDPPRTSVAGTVTLSGTASYDSVPNTTGSLDYQATSSKPVRGASVEIVDAGSTSVLATATTDAQGAYAASLPANTEVFVRVKAELVQGEDGAGPSWTVTVRDNTQSNALYAMETPAFSTGMEPLTRDMHAGSGWGGTKYDGLRVAAPFAVLDTVYAAQAKLLAVAPNTVFPKLRVFWSVNNVAASGNLALGQIGTTFFRAGSDEREIYVLGKEDADTDEYDSSVIAHEWGHYYQNAFSRDDSPGGSHSDRDRLDRRVAFSEGWGNAWSGVALARTSYTDSSGPAQSRGFSIDLTAGASQPAGWYRTASIASIFWKLNSQLGLKPINDTMTSSFKTAIPVTSIHSFAAAFTAAAPDNASALTSLLAAESISSAPNDPFGTAETNDGGVALSVPLYRRATVGDAASVCVSNLAGARNKLGNITYLMFTAAAARSYAIGVFGPTGSDPDFSLMSGPLSARSTGTGINEIARFNLSAGDYVLAINDYNNASANTCFTVLIQ